MTCACEANAVPGVVYETSIGGDDRGMGFAATYSADVAACMACNRYPNDLEAARAFAAAMGGAWIVTDWEAGGVLAEGQTVRAYESFDAALEDLRDRIGQPYRGMLEDPVATEGRVEYIEGAV